MTVYSKKPTPKLGLFVTLVTLTVLCLVWMHFAGSPTAPSLSPAVEDEFTMIQPAAQSTPAVLWTEEKWENWEEDYQASAPTEQDDLLKEGIALARERRAAMLELIQSDPEAALAAAIPRAEREKLPREIQEQLETFISARAPLDHIHTCFHPDEPDKCTHDHEAYLSTFIGGREYRVHVYGDRLYDMSIPHSSMHGIAIDGHLAISESRVRVLEPGEPLPAGISLPTPDAIAVEANGEVTVLASTDELAGFEEAIRAGEDNPTYLIEADAGDGTSTVIDRPSEAHATGDKKMLVVLVDFDDLQGRPLNISAGNAPITEDMVNDLINGPDGVRQFYQESSFGKTDILLTPPVNGVSPDITEVLRMPNTASYYANEGGASRLMNEGRALAETEGYPIADYDRILIVHTNLRNFDGGTKFNTFAGIAWTRSSVSAYNGYWDFRVVAHELGHNWGLRHANLWQVTDGDPGSLSGTSLPYGNNYDTMGAGTGSPLKHFSPWGKSLLWWIPDTAIPAAQVSDTYRVYRFDHKEADLTLPRALKIVRNDVHDYWISYRRTDPADSLYNGAYVQFGYNRGNEEAELLDMNTPGSDIADAALNMNQTYTDSSGAIEFTPVDQGGSGADEWIDIQVQFYDPGAEFASSSYTVNQDGGSVTITVNRVQSSIGSLSVDYATSSGTAIAPDDYTTTTGTLTWADGDVEPKTFQVPIIDGPAGETEENFTVSLSSPVGGILGVVDTTTVTITAIVNEAPVVNLPSEQLVYMTGNVWSPASLSPLAWYDASDSSSITHTDNKVSQWSNKAGSSHMVQASETNMPLTGTSQINGLNAIAFDGSDDGLMTAGNPFGTSISDAMFMAVTNIGTLSNSTMFSLTGSQNAANRWQSHAPWGNGSLYFDCGGTGAPNRVFGASGWTANQNLLLGFYGSTTDNVQEVWADGTRILNDASGHTVNVVSGLALGYVGEGQGSYDNCSMGEVVILNSTVPAADRQILEGYLAHKWGLLGNLPTDHPYKTINPNDGSGETSLAATATDADGHPLTYSWSFVSGPGPVTFDTPNALDTTVSFTAPGVYTIRLSVSDIYTTVTKDVVVTVNPPISGYTVTYNGNGSTGGSVPVDANSPYDDGATVTVLDNTGSLTRSVYSFAGWNTAADGSGISYSAGSTFSISSNTTLYARWTAEPPVVDAGADQTVNLTVAAPPAPVTGVSIFLDAGLDDGANNIWEDSLSTWSPTIDTANVTFVADAGSNLPGITSAYAFPGGLAGDGGCEGPSLDTLNNAHTKPITLEIWFKPDASESYPTIGQVLWESGHTSGFGIYYKDGVIQALHDSNSGLISTDVSGLTDEFIQLVVTYDTGATTNNYKMYVNGELKVTASRTDANISGADGSGLGVMGGFGPGGVATSTDTTSFDGKIAIFRSYHDRTLNAAEVLKNYQSIAGPSAQATLAGTATDPGSLPLTTQWTIVSGPGPVTFGDGSNPATTANFSVAGVYTLRLTADNGAAQASDDVVITVNPPVISGFTVTYNGNGSTGGSVPVDANNPYDDGATVTVLGNTGSLTRTGYSFDDWNTADDGLGTDYTAGSTFTISANTTLHAQWTPNSYTVTFDANGGASSNPASKSVTFDATYGTLATTTRTGYSFAGWFTAASGGTQVTDATTVAITADQTLYAQWTPDTYLVTYLGNGNDSGTAPADQDKLHDTALILATNSGNLVKTGSSFIGWNTADDGSGTDFPAGGTYTANAPLTLYAKWSSVADGTWLPTLAGPFDWSDPANWTSGIIASGVDRTAFFTPDFTENQTVNLDTDRTIGNITFTDSTTSSHDLTISGANTLTLARTSGAPVINVTQAGRSLTIATPIAGTNGLAKDGTGTLSITSASSFTGGVTINGGAIEVTSSVLNNQAILIETDGTLLANSIAALGTGTITPRGTLHIMQDGGGTITNAFGPIGRSRPNATVIFDRQTAGAADDWIIDVPNNIANNFGAAAGSTVTFQKGANVTSGTPTIDVVDGFHSSESSNAGAIGYTADGVNLRFNGHTNSRGRVFTFTANTHGNEIYGAMDDSNNNQAVSMTFQGTGTWNLSRAAGNGYTGGTTVSGGTLLVNNTTGSGTGTGTVTVGANGTLGGTGIIGAETTIADGGGLAFDLSTPAASHDKLELAATKSLTFSGASVLTITGTTGAEPGAYTLLTAPGGISGSAPATVNLPAGWVATASIVGNDLVLDVTSVGVTPYNGWAAANSLAGADADPQADFDNDGVNNLLEYALGMDPNVRAGFHTMSHYEPVNGSKHWVFTLKKYSGRTDVNLYLKRSLSLQAGSWTTIASMIAGGQLKVFEGAAIIEQSGSAPETLRISDPNNGSTKAFYRWEAEAP